MPTRVRGNGEGKPVVALDIDGTLGDYHAHFLWFAEKWLGMPMPPPQRLNPGLRLHKFMEIRLADYRACKLAYRQGGLKRFMPAYPGAAELTYSLRRAGAQVWICTTRPYLRLDNIDPDTREWLRRNEIQYDAVLFGDDKYRELKRQAGTRVAAVMDDLPALLHEAERLFPSAWVVRMMQPYNRTDDSLLHLRGVEELWQANDLLLQAIKQWKDRGK